MLNSIGTDLEVFAKNKQGNHIALCGKIGGTKEEPLQIKGLPRGFMVQEDNVALEFNIPVCNTRVAFVEAMGLARNNVEDILFNLDLKMSKNSSVSFDTQELQHPNALVFGCEPDYNAWSKSENPRPEAKDRNLRTAGGHIHVGSDINMIDGIRNMDLFLGVPSILLDDTPESLARRELYGKAGAMRPKPYGFEYRVLSNFWMFSNKMVSWVYDQTKRACLFKHTFTKSERTRITNCINTSNKVEAEKLVLEFGLVLPA